MKERILPAYLLLCLIIGGSSSQGVWANALLQLLAVAILAWAALTIRPQRVPAAGRRLLFIVLAGLALIALQLIPLPPALWTAMPGRELPAEGFRLIGMGVPWQPISLAPYNTMSSALALLPALALLVGMLRLRAWNTAWMFAVVILGAAISIVLGILQVSGGENGSWYFYRRTNLGVAVGTFANGNHYATLLLAALPLLGGLAVSKWRATRKQQERSLVVALAIAAAAILAIGVLINQSTAMLLLGPPVAAATALLALRISRKRVRQGLLAIAAMLVVLAGGFALIGKDAASWGTSASIETRSDYWSRTARAAMDQPLTGSGMGTFEQVYRQYEDPAVLDRWYVNHAHNDYLELALEGGAAAVILILVFLGWWAGRAREAWQSPTALDRKAAMVASAAILLHSLIDYPLRTAGISAVFAMCLALLAGARGTTGQSDLDEAERPRHATL